jgi:hypothetical protein
MAGSCEHGSEPSDSVKGRELLAETLLASNQDSAPRNQSVSFRRKSFNV